MPENSLPVEFLFRLECDTSPTPSTIISDGPHGTRFVVDASSGTFAGPRLNGTVHGPGGDWSTLTATGTVRIDVRLMLHTDDGADILMTYLGVGVAVDGGLRALTAPRFEVGDERYRWLNDIQAVAIGGFTSGGIAYDVYALQ